MFELIDKAKEEIRRMKTSSFFWIFLTAISTALGVYHERFATKVIKAYQIFYFLAVFFLLAFLVEWLERRRTKEIMEELIEKLKELSEEEHL